MPTPSAPAPAISKNPTNETHYAGDSALFIANANPYTSVSWTAVSPDGTEYDMDGFRNAFPGSTVSGETTGSLTIGNLRQEMSGWNFYCVFSNQGTPARSGSASLNVLAGVRTQNQPQAITYVTCPICGNQVASNTAVCPYCNEYINSGTEDYYYDVDDNGNGIYADETGAVLYNAETGITYVMDPSGSYKGYDEGGNLVDTGYFG